MSLKVASIEQICFSVDKESQDDLYVVFHGILLENKFAYLGRSLKMTFCRILSVYLRVSRLSFIAFSSAERKLGPLTGVVVLGE